MFEATALLCFFLAFASVYAAREQRFPVQHFSSVRFHPSGALLFGLRVFAAALALFGVHLWAQTDGVTAALLVGLSATCAFAALLVLLTPLLPRVMWLAVATSLVAVALLTSTRLYG